MAKAVSSLSSRILKPILRLNDFQQLTKAVRYSSSIMTDIVKPMETSIKKKLTETFKETETFVQDRNRIFGRKPEVLQIINESYMHNVPKGSETHFKVVVVSDAFEGVSLVQRHRHVNTTLEEEFGSGLHALSIVAKTPAQWKQSSQTVGPSPPCRGGAGL